MTSYPHLDRIIADAAKLGRTPVAVAFPCSGSAIEAAVKAERLGLIQPIMVGPRAAIEAMAQKASIDVGRLEFLDTGDDPVKAAAASVNLCREGNASAIMKGSLHTDELLGAVVAKEAGMRTSRRISHAFVFDVPTYAKPLLMADCVVNIAPDLISKRDIIQNAADLARTLGVELPLVAVLSAVETINPAIPGTLEAAALSKMADRGQITGCIVDGPLAFDNAISADAARIKGITSPVAGNPDVLIAPNLEAGNMLYKQLVYLGKAECAGIILGTKVPVILTSRADSEMCRVASCALAALHASR